MTASDVKSWAQKVFKQLERVADLDTDHFTFLAGEKYRKYLLPHIKYYALPMQGLSIGKQLKWLAENTQ